MKNFVFLLIALSLLPVSLRASAELDDYETIQWPGQPAVSAIGRKYALRPILEGKTLTVSLWIDGEKRGERELYTSLIKDGYNAWFQYAVQQIKAQGREAEFPDILGYIDRPIPIIVIPEGGANVQVRVWKNAKSLVEHCAKQKDVGGCYHDRQIELNKTEKIEAQRSTMIHEIGHSLGLADQNHLGMQKASPLYASYQIIEEIMDKSPQLACGDVDGLINLMDRTLQLQRPGGARWKSFCHDSVETFKNGISSYASRFFFAQKGAKTMIQEYEDSEKIAETVLSYADKITDPFYVPRNPVVLKRDSVWRPALLRSDQGEYIYQLHGQEEEYTEQIIVQNNKVLSTHYTFSAKDQDNTAEHIFLRKGFSLGKGRKGVLTCEYGESVRAAIYEEFKLGEQKPYFTVYVRFNKGDKDKTKHILSEGESGDSVLFSQFYASTGVDSVEGVDVFQKRQSAWVTRFVTFVSHWPEYLGFLPAN